MYNTPPVFSIYVVMLVTRWLRDEIGGLDAMLRAQPCEGDAALRRDRRDPRTSTGAMPNAASRSLMNVTFRLPSRGLERAFLAEPPTTGMVELKGHRSVGGIRASLYNAMPVEGVEALADFMRGSPAR